MMVRTQRWLGASVSASLLAAACWSLVVACGSDDAREAFRADDARDASDATTQPPAMDGSFSETDAGACAPVAPPPRTAPPPTKRFQSGACTTAQLDGYLNDCLQSDGNVCNAFKAANAGCAACVESASSEASWGPIVFYGNRRYYDYNYGGCIANVTGDFSQVGCGAAQTRYLECRHVVCEACLPQSLPLDYAPFYACQATKATDALCATELADVGSACAAYFAAKPGDVCQSGGLPPNDYLRKLVTGWCGGSPADAGGDGGDVGDGG